MSPLSSSLTSSSFISISPLIIVLLTVTENGGQFCNIKTTVNTSDRLQNSNRNNNNSYNHHTDQRDNNITTTQHLLTYLLTNLVRHCMLVQCDGKKNPFAALIQYSLTILAIVCRRTRSLQVRCHNLNKNTVTSFSHSNESTQRLSQHLNLNYLVSKKLHTLTYKITKKKNNTLLMQARLERIIIQNDY